MKWGGCSSSHRCRDPCKNVPSSRSVVAMQMEHRVHSESPLQWKHASISPGLERLLRGEFRSLALGPAQIDASQASQSRRMGYIALVIIFNKMFDLKPNSPCPTRRLRRWSELGKLPALPCYSGQHRQTPPAAHKCSCTVKWTKVSS